MRVGLAIAKANRHLALIITNTEQQDHHLGVCFAVIKELREKKKLFDRFSKNIICDEAQIYHARAFLIARNLGIHLEGQISRKDASEEKLTREALTEVSKAIKMFNEIKDMEREAKALVLKERLYKSLGEEIDALEAKARREVIISRSGIDGSISFIALTESSLKNK